MAMKKKHKLIFVILFFMGALLNITAQEIKSNDSTETFTQEERFQYLIEGDSIAVDAVALNEVLILKPIKFKTKKERRDYFILKRKTLKVYPYAKMASDTLTRLKNTLHKITKKRKQKKHIRRMQRFLEKKFTPELKKMTRTEGQILVKLIYRQTHQTMFDLIKNYRNGFKAFVYQTTANLFDISLKADYDPWNNYQDYWIEDILTRNLQDGILEDQESPLQIDFLELKDHWKSNTNSSLKSI